MKKNIKLDSIRKEYYSKLIASKMSVDDMMPLFAKAMCIFDLGKPSKAKKK